MANPAYIPMRPENYPASVSERRAQQAEIVMAIDFLEEQQEQAARDQNRLKELEGILREMSEIIRPGLERSPDLPVSEITPHQARAFLAAASSMIYGDPHAGAVLLPEGPITRRALAAALRHTQEGLVRSSMPLAARQKVIADRLEQAHTISAALTVAENGLGYALRREVKGLGVEPHHAWFFDFDSALAQFNFQKLNHTEIHSYFCQGF